MFEVDIKWCVFCTLSLAVCFTRCSQPGWNELWRFSFQELDLSLCRWHFDDVKLASSLHSVLQVLMVIFYIHSVAYYVKMNYARNYKNLLNFVKAMPKILVVPFFPDTMYSSCRYCQVCMSSECEITNCTYGHCLQWSTVLHHADDWLNVTHVVYVIERLKRCVAVSLCMICLRCLNSRHLSVTSYVCYMFQSCTCRYWFPVNKLVGHVCWCNCSLELLTAVDVYR